MQPASAVVGGHEQRPAGRRDDGAVGGEHHPVEAVGEPLRGPSDIVAGAASWHQPETDAPAVQDSGDALPHRVLGTGWQVQHHQGVLRVGGQPPGEGQRPAVDEAARVDQQRVAHIPGLQRRPGRPQRGAGQAGRQPVGEVAAGRGALVGVAGHVS
ncbi:hypothetical protein [Streptomyces griseorubiginosus]